MFFTAVNPMFVDQHKEAEYHLTNPRIPVYKNYWTIHQNTVDWFNLKVAQGKGLQFCQTRSNAIILNNTLLALCTEKVVYMKTGEELNSKVCQSPRLPRRAALTPNLHREHPSTIKAKKVRSTGKPVVKSSGKPEAATSTSEYKVCHTQPFNRGEFETHPNRESLKADSEKNQKFNLFSEKSNTSRCARSLLKYNAKIAYYTGKQAQYIVLAVHACDHHKRIAN